MLNKLASDVADFAINETGLDKVAKNSFLLVIEFLDEYPDQLSSRKSKKALLKKGSEEYYLWLAKKYFSARAKIMQPGSPTTVPDPMVSYILEVYFGYPAKKTEEMKLEHQRSMAAENLVGALLERYVGLTLEAHGWAWCAGGIVRAIDLLKKNKDGSWHLLQVKNRDNTENSSSSAIRDGTEIVNWFRTFSATGETNWHAFPDERAKGRISEEGFKVFVQDYLGKDKKVTKK